MQDTQTLRKQIKLQRQSLSIAKQTQASLAIFNQLKQESIFQDAQSVGIYLSFKGEVDTTPIIDHLWQNNKHCFIPVIAPEQNQLSFHPYTPDTKMTKNRFDILEPSKLTKALPLTQLDLVITPLVAFDKACNRIGMGKGFYDRTFEDDSTRPPLVGLAYDFQAVQTITPNPWDVPLTLVITNQTIYRG